uniref:Uncharacterized protein n=1 Tax=Romanomermis culicivorax TaxID=13658 RepID=A0A915HL88_ROMCU
TACIDQVCTKAPLKPKAGDVYLFYYSVTNRNDGYQWKNDGQYKLKSSNIQNFYFEKLWFKSQQSNLNCDSRSADVNHFKKYEIRWLDAKYCIGLSHYYGNENVATAQSSENVKNQNVPMPHVRNAPIIKAQILNMLLKDGQMSPMQIYDKLMNSQCAPEYELVLRPSSKK